MYFILSIFYCSLDFIFTLENFSFFITVHAAPKRELGYASSHCRFDSSSSIKNGDIDYVRPLSLEELDRVGRFNYETWSWSSNVSWILPGKSAPGLSFEERTHSWVDNRVLLLPDQHERFVKLPPYVRVEFFDPRTFRYSREPPIIPVGELPPSDTFFHRFAPVLEPMRGVSDPLYHNFKPVSSQSACASNTPYTPPLLFPEHKRFMWSIPPTVKVQFFDPRTSLWSSHPPLLYTKEELLPFADLRD